MKEYKIGFIGQGFIGKNMADDFAERGYNVVRFALEAEYVGNREAIADCDFVFIAVPTPTTPQGFDISVVENVLPLIGKGKTAVIKSTVLPGTTKVLQGKFTDINIVHSPEFLRELHARDDAKNPPRTIVGLPNDDENLQALAKELLSILPTSPYQLICTAEEAELIKYGGNCFLTLKLVYMNLLYDLSLATGADYNVVADGIGADSRIGQSHTKVLSEDGKRGAGGHCFPKDLAALREVYESLVTDDVVGREFFKVLERKNNQLLHDSGKDIDLLKEMYSSHA